MDRRLPTPCVIGRLLARYTWLTVISFSREESRAEYGSLFWSLSCVTTRWLSKTAPGSCRDGSPDRPVCRWTQGPQICINILSRCRTSYSRRIISCSHR